MMQLRRFAGRLVRGGGGPSFCRRSCTTSIAPEVTVEDALAAIAKEPILHRLGSIFHPWPQVAKVVSPQELHSQLGTFASTTGTVGALLSSVIGAGLLAEPPKYSSEAQEKHGRGSQVHAKEIPLLERLLGWRPLERERDDAYYVLLTTGFFCSIQTVITSTIILTNLMAIPSSLTSGFVVANAHWISAPAFLIAPTCVCATSALCIAIESEFGEKVSFLAWGANLLLLMNSSVCVLSMLNTNHVLRTKALMQAAMSRCQTR